MIDEDEHEDLFTNWLSEHGSQVLKVARAYTWTHEECQDLAQEILLQAWKSLPGFRGTASPSTWFYRVALHTALKWQRRRESRRSTVDRVFEIDTLASSDEDHPCQVEQREAIEKLYEAIHQLRSTEAALVLMYLDELTYREMADVLGLSENNVGVKLNRAKKALARLLEESTEDHSDES